MNVIPAAAQPPAPVNRERYRQIRTVTLVGSLVDLLLGVLKIVGGWFAQSQALIVDGVHSISDLVTDFMVLFAAKHANVEPDDEHPYGHARIETAATVGLGVTLVLVALGLGYDAVTRLMQPERLLHPQAWALGIAFVSVVSKEAVYQYTMVYARRLRSKMLRANAWHSRSDALSSLVVIAGVGGSLLGFETFDAAAALVVAWMIARIGWEVASASMRELIDTGLAPDQLEGIRATILSIGGVADLHMLRTRQMGGRALVDVHIILEDPRVSVSEGHYISETVRERLIETIEDVEDVMVHIDPEDDEALPPDAANLGLRRQVLEHLDARWAPIPAAGRIRRVDLHYLDGRIQVEVELPLDIAIGGDPDGLADEFAKAAEGVPGVSTVRLVYARDAPE